MRNLVIACMIGGAACGGKAAPATGTPTAGSGAAAPAGSDDGGDASRRVYDFAGEVVTSDSGATTAEPVGGPRPPDKLSVRDQIRRHMGAIVACISKDASARGQVELVFGIAASGAIGDVYVNGPGTDETHACVTEAVKGLSFAADPAGIVTEVHYPITFKGA